jgi:hypothetical protein
MDHDTAYIHITPPIQNQWYTVAHVYDLRELLFAVACDDDEGTEPSVEVRWTIDGNVYFTTLNTVTDVLRYVMRDIFPSTGGTLGLSERGYVAGDTQYDNKRGLDGLFEIRTLGVPGTNAFLDGYLLYETLEVT